MAIEPFQNQTLIKPRQTNQNACNVTHGPKKHLPRREVNGNCEGMDTPTVLEKPKQKQRVKRINYALAATLLSQHLTYEQTAKQVGAKNANSLKAGMMRRGVTATLTRSNDFRVEQAVMVATKAVSQASEALRGKFSGLLENAANKLCNVEVNANVKELKSLGEAAEPFVRMAKIVHDWGNDSPSGLVLTGEVAQALDCGVDATIGSVPIEAEVKQIPQDTQTTNPETPAQ